VQSWRQPENVPGRKKLGLVEKRSLYSVLPKLSIIVKWLFLCELIKIKNTPQIKMLENYLKLTSYIISIPWFEGSVS
jgi:hypothetical protein